MQAKTTRAFRTISEAGEELDLQPHVLRFWESKFPQIKPMKRGGGRRFYRPEDIEFLRGIKILLHDEKHPIKDVQKLIRMKGANSVVELGRSMEKAAKDRSVEDTVLIPERIVQADPPPRPKPKAVPEPEPILELVEEAGDTEIDYAVKDETESAEYESEDAADIDEAVTIPSFNSSLLSVHSIEEAAATLSPEDVANLQDALSRLTRLRARWNEFQP